MEAVFSKKMEKRGVGGVGGAGGGSWKENDGTQGNMWVLLGFCVRLWLSSSCRSDAEDIFCLYLKQNKTKNSVFSLYASLCSVPNLI